MKPRRVRVKGWPGQVPDEVVAQAWKARQQERAGSACPKCGVLLEPGCWPWCPHSKDVAYSFRGDFR